MERRKRVSLGRDGQSLSLIPWGGTVVEQRSAAGRKRRRERSGDRRCLCRGLRQRGRDRQSNGRRSGGKRQTFCGTSAQKNYEDMLNPTKLSTKYQTQKMMPQLLGERPNAMTRQGTCGTGREHKPTKRASRSSKPFPGLQGSMNDAAGNRRSAES